MEDAGVMSFFIGNPTRWGPVAKNFVKASSHDVVGLCETHKDKEDVKTLEAHRLPGRFAYWSPAEQLGQASSEGGSRWSNHGGIFMAAKNSAAATTRGAARGSAGWDVNVGIGRCWLALLLVRLPVVLATLYLDDSVGLSTTNVGRVAEVIQYAAAAKRFLIMGGGLQRHANGAFSLFRL